MDGGLGRAVHLGAQPERVGQMGDPHRAGHPAAVVRARPDVGGATRGDEVGGVEVATVRGLADEERDVDALGKPLVRGDAELVDRLLVPAVIRLREGMPDVDRVGEVEAGRAVIHQVDVWPHVVAQPLAELGVGARVAPRVKLDRGIAELEALVGDIEELLDRGERRRGRASGDLIAIGAEQPVNGDTEDAALEVPESDVNNTQEPDRELLRTVELPEPVPEPLPSLGSLADELVSEYAVHDVGEHRSAPLVVGLADCAIVRRDAEDGGCARTV